MILKKIKIMNYRQLESVELDMQESLTVLVGPNNSGKTTLISVLKGMFCDKKLGFSYSDIPISLSSMWLEKTVPVFQEIMLEYDKEKGVQKIIDEMTDNDKLSKDYTIDNFRAQIQVDYDPDSDNIQYFADYLMDLDDTKHTSVIFVASDNVNTPNVRMYPFFELWSKLEFSLPQFEELFYSYSKIIEEVEKGILLSGACDRDRECEAVCDAKYG